MDYDIFEEPKYQSYELSIKGVHPEIKGSDIKLYKNLKLEKKFKELDTKYLERSNDSKKDYKKYSKKLTKEEINIFETTYFMDMTKIFKKMFYVQKNFNTGPGFTNAWRKMYEICEKTNFIPKKIKDIKHLDICGSPGAFVLAINHFIKTKRKSQNYDWYIQSYTGDIGLEDQYHLYENYPDRFLEGPAMGDITLSESVLYYYDFFRNKKMNIVTSDCGLSPAEVWQSKDKNITREKQMLKIFYGQLITAFGVLDKGGNLFMKSYSTFTPFSISFIYLMCCFFKKVKLVKPISSRYPEGNEIYYLCEDFIEIIDEDVFYKLTGILHTWEDNTFSKNITSYAKMDKELLENIQNQMSIFYQKRLDDLKEKEEIYEELLGTTDDMIEDPVRYLTEMKQLEKISDRQTIRFANNYIKKMKYQRIKREDRLL